MAEQVFADRGELATASEADRRIVDRGSLRLLCVDDNATNRLVLGAALGMLGAKAAMAADGREAVTLWEGGDFDLIFMDVCMPVLDGVSAAREIRALEAKTGRLRTPIVAVTANVDAGQICACLEAGMDQVIGKPIAVPMIEEALLAHVAWTSTVPRKAL